MSQCEPSSQTSDAEQPSAVSTPTLATPFATRYDMPAHPQVSICRVVTVDHCKVLEGSKSNSMLFMPVPCSSLLSIIQKKSNIFDCVGLGVGQGVAFSRGSRDFRRPYPC
jgi:hypothetical protein